MKKLGLIAGSGNLPMVVAREARQKGHTLFAVGLSPLADEQLSDVVDEVEYINVGKLGRIIDALKNAGVSEAVMAGKVPKTLLYKSKIIPDLRAIKVLLSLKDRRDDTIMIAIVEELQREGITLLNTTSFTESLMAKEGVMTKKKPTRFQRDDVSFGFPVAKKIGGLDIGQSIVVKDRAVMAVEAIEGTDEAIRRGGRLCGDGAVVIKVAKIGQDLRFDVPAVGMTTISAMREVKAAVLALEADATIIVDKLNVLREADSAGISVLGVGASSEGVSG
ncbi:MAG: LpxI family protein [Thermodesulfovibrionales bacterium]